MTGESFTVFDTAIGPCGLAWRAHGIVGVQLPERDWAATEARLHRRFPAAVGAAPSPAMRRAMDAIIALLRGEPRDMGDITLDMTGISPFRQRLYATLRGIPPSRTITYGALAGRLGEGCTARDVGEAMGKNPFPIIVPCHRVVAANGKAGGFSAPGGVATKLRMLTIEQARVDDMPVLFGNLPLAAAPQRR